MSIPRRLAALAAVSLFASRAFAGPLCDPHVGGIGFSGPTSGDLTAVYWNPAGLGLLQGPQMMVAGALEVSSVSVERTSIDPATGANPGSQTFPAASGGSTLHPIRWPLGPSSFLGLGAGIGRRFGIGLALFSPYSSHLTMNPTADGQEPARYHLVSMDFNHLALATGIAIHASDSIQIGAAPGLLFPTARLVFDEVTGPLDPSAPAAGREDRGTSARYDLATRGILFPAYYLSFGAHYRRGRFSLGLAYTTAPLGTGSTVNLPLDDTQIRPLSGAGAGTSLCPSSRPNCLVGRMSYRLPSTYVAGATWRSSPGWAVTGILRLVRNSAHDKITILIADTASQPVLGTSVPDHVVLYRGFRDSLDVRARVVYASKDFRVGGTLRFETGAVPASHVNAAAVDGNKIEPSLAAELRIWRQIRLGAGYAFTWMFPVDTGASVFDPTAADTCAAAAGDLDTPACQARLAGQARPSAAGNYRLWRHTLSVLATFAF